MSQNITHTLEKIDKLIRAGQGNQARKEVWKMGRMSLLREQRLPVARLCRRVGLYSLGLKILNPIVRPTGKKLLKATDNENAEYAALLTYLSANEEALGILKTLNPEKSPEIHLFQAFALFNQWNYDAAIICLESHLQSPNLNEYQRLIGELNLAAAFVNERMLDRAKPLLEELIYKTKGENTKLLHGNALELAGQTEIYCKNFSKAKNLLTQSKRILTGGQGLSHAYANKWLAILALMEGKNPNAKEELIRVKTNALEFKYSEVVRDCDRFLGIAEKNPALLEKVYFGTPFPRFRERLLIETKSWFQPKNEYIQTYGTQNKRQETLEVSTYPLPKYLHRLFNVLTSDFYRPFSVASLHAKVFENEFYHPTATPMKMHKLIQRLRKEFKKSNFPLEIKHTNSYFELTCNKPFSLIVKLQDEQFQTPSLEALRKHFGTCPFGSEEAAKIVQLTSRTILRLLKEGLANHSIVKIGKGPATQYAFQEAYPIEQKKAA